MTRVSSIFSQTLQLISRLEFESAVRKQGAERHGRGFSCWGQFIAMLFCQLGHAKSLREICGGLAASEGKLRHLGLPQAPARATLAYAKSTSALAVVPDGVRPIAGEVSEPGGQPTRDAQEEEVPFQEPADELGRLGDRSRRYDV